MNWREAQRFWGRRMYPALMANEPAGAILDHPGKSAAIYEILQNRKKYYALLVDAKASGDHVVLDLCGSMPWMGDESKYRLAQYVGVNIDTPDRRLRIYATISGESMQGMYERIKLAPGYPAVESDVIRSLAYENDLVDQSKITKEIYAS